MSIGKKGVIPLNNIGEKFRKGVSVLQGMTEQPHRKAKSRQGKGLEEAVVKKEASFNRSRCELQLLNNIDGIFAPGVMTALMGSTGAGKTTLMDVLAGRKTGQNTGAIQQQGNQALNECSENAMSSSLLSTCNAFESNRSLLVKRLAEHVSQLETWHRKPQGNYNFTQLHVFRTRPSVMLVLRA